jgi:hypothetical protein
MTSPAVACPSATDRQLPILVRHIYFGSSSLRSHAGEQAKPDLPSRQYWDKMVFGPPSWVPQLSHEIPDSIPVGEFALNGNTVPAARPPFIDAITGNSYSLQVLRDRVEWLARALAREFRWSPNQGSPWDKVVGIFSMNTVRNHCLCNAGASSDTVRSTTSFSAGQCIG